MIPLLNSPLRPESLATALATLGSSREPRAPVLGFPKTTAMTPPKRANCRPTAQIGQQKAPKVARSDRPARTRTRVMLLDNHLGNQEKCIASVYRSSPTRGSAPTPAAQR